MDLDKFTTYATPVALLIGQGIYGYYSSKRAAKIARELDKAKVKQEQIHQLVNSTLTTANAAVASLTARNAE